MDELFQELETRIIALINRCEQLERENSSLQQSASSLIREKESLSAKNNMAISHIENMLSRLKSIESVA